MRSDERVITCQTQVFPRVTLAIGLLYLRTSQVCLEAKLEHPETIADPGYWRRSSSPSGWARASMVRLERQRTTA